MNLVQHQSVYAALSAQCCAVSISLAEARCALDNAASEVEAEIAKHAVRYYTQAFNTATDMLTEYHHNHLSALAIAAAR